MITYWRAFLLEGKSAQGGEDGGARPPSFTISTITDKGVVYATTERTETLPLFLLYPYMYSVEIQLCVQEGDIQFYLKNRIRGL